MSLQLLLSLYVFCRLSFPHFELFTKYFVYFCNNIFFSLWFYVYAYYWFSFWHTCAYKKKKKRITRSSHARTKHEQLNEKKVILCQSNGRKLLVRRMIMKFVATKLKPYGTPARRCQFQSAAKRWQWLYSSSSSCTAVARAR